MSRLTMPTLALTMLLIVAACGGPAATGSPTTGGSPAAPTSDPSGSPHDPGPSGSPGASTPVDPSASIDPPGSVDPASPPASGDPTEPPTEPPATGFDPRRVQLGLEEVVTGLDSPVAVTHAGDGTGTLYVVERAGTIRVLSADGSLADEPLLDISDRVDTQGERGLHYVVFHPEFESNRRFFVHWTDGSDRSFIQEYTAEGEGTVPRDSARTILRTDTRFWNHKGGWMGFGPDGMLYIAIGDGGGDTPGDPLGYGQGRTELLGNILRIDVDGERPYAVPSDNPYAGAGNGEGPLPEIWAYGLRNPWRASFDRETGALWIGDVGQDTAEEINVIPAGAGGLNFGWSDTEGYDCHLEPDCDPTDFVLPVTTYGTRDEGCAITGGYVYRGEASPVLTGGYLFTDYCTGEIWGLDAAIGLETGRAEYARLLRTDHLGVSMGEDEAGELYLVDFAGGIYRITATER